MVKQKITIGNPTGLHLRPAGIFCNVANEFPCKVMFEYGDGNVANAKSVLGVLGACIKMGDEIVLVCDGDREEEALRTMVQAIEDGLGE